MLFRKANYPTFIFNFNRFEYKTNRTFPLFVVMFLTFA